MAEDDPGEPDLAPSETEGEDSLVADLRNLAEDVRTAIEAESGFQSARAGYVAGEARSIALWFAIAGLVAVIALCTLAVGVLLGLIPLIGPWLATLAVVGALLVAAVVAGMAGNKAVGRVKRNAFPAKVGGEP